MVQFFLYICLCVVFPVGIQSGWVAGLSGRVDPRAGGAHYLYVRGDIPRHQKNG